MRIGGERGDADLAGRDGGDVDLERVTPVELHEIGPGRDAVMTAEAEAAQWRSGRIDAGPASHARCFAIGADNPAAANGLAAAQHHDMRADGGDRRPPLQVHARALGGIHQDAMQRGAAHSDGASGWETRLGREGGFYEPDAVERHGVGGAERDAQLFERGDAVRQQALTAGLVDGRMAGVGEGDAKATAPRGDGRGQAGRASAGHEDVEGLCQSYHLNRTSSEQKPGPIAASRPHVPGAGRRRSMVSSSTWRTDAEERLPALRSQSQETASWPSCRPSASCMPSTPLGPPVCRSQQPMSLRLSPWPARNSSVSWPRCLRAISGTSADRTMRKPFSEMFQPITSSVPG